MMILQVIKAVGPVKSPEEGFKTVEDHTKVNRTSEYYFLKMLLMSQATAKSNFKKVLYKDRNSNVNERKCRNCRNCVGTVGNVGNV